MNRFIGLLEFLRNKFIYLVVITKIALTAFAITMSTKSFPIPVIVTGTGKGKILNNTLVRKCLAFILRVTRNSRLQSSALKLVNKIELRNIEFSWTIKVNELLEQLSQVTPETVDLLDENVRLSALKLSAIMNMGCPGMAVNWKACELNPAYPQINTLYIRMFELGMFDEVYSFQQKHNDDVIKIAFETSV